MASTISPTLQALSLRRACNAHPPPCKAHCPKSFASRRQLLFLLTAIPALTVRESASNAEDIPLFGLRKKLKKAEEKAEEIVKEGFEAAEKGLETAEKGIVTAEKGIETAEREIEEAVSFGGLAQAGAVAGAEVVGVLVATSVVNGILGSEAKGQKS
ncbi:hypothetical protein MANES_13G132100v8 [Manihot esculenta]|uniref:Synechocystis YCF37 n=2 Tax=Manihot esculenta TaxID=3983 RepID=A0A2C9URE4_MANES|nr:hypothetical protein MANES_13G132100v8 [Manihot esculenta]